MNPTLATGPLAQAIGWALLHLLWQGAVIAALLAFALALFSGRSANVRYIISCAALGLLIVSGVVTGIRSYPTHAISVTPLLHGETPALQVGTSGLATAIGTPMRSERIQSLARKTEKSLPIIVTMWLVGVTFLSARLLVQWLRSRRLTKNARTAPEPWQSAALRLSDALGVRYAVRLLESAAVEIPSVIGLVSPAILLPASTITGLTPMQLEMILAHELAHIRRHDFLVNLLQAVVETLLFYHPAVWWISKQVRIERENCCDDLAVAACGTPLQYARALTRLEELRAQALPLAVSANGGSLLERVRRIVGGSRPATGPAVHGAAATAMLVCMLVALAAHSLSGMSKQSEARQAVEMAAVVDVSHNGDPVAVSHTAVETETTVETKATEVTKPVDTVHAEVETKTSAPTVAVHTAVETNESLAAVVGEHIHTKSAPGASKGHQGKLSLDEIIQLRAQGVTPETVRELRRLFPDIEVTDIAGMSAVGATPEYVREIRGAGLKVKSAGDAQGLAALGVTAEYLHEIRAAGLPVETAGDAQGLKAVGVTGEGIRELRHAGLSVESAGEAQGLAAQGVTAEYVSGLRAAGLRIESASEATSLAALGVTPDYVRDMRRAGVDFKGASDLQSLRALGVTPEFVERLARAGYRNLSVSDLTRLAAGGMDDLIEELSKYRSH